MNTSDTTCIGLDLNKLKTLREHRGLTLDQAATLAGMSSRHRWNDIESGRKANITLATLDAIAKALGVKSRDLLK